MERLITTANGTRLGIDDRGDPTAPLVLQVEGHMAQLVSTPVSYCDRLVERGLRVIRVDNRDVGRSQRFPDTDYTLEDMAEDLFGLLTVLERPAVVCGRSMGGAIAQLLALAHPSHVSGLGLFFTFARDVATAPDPIDPAPFADEASFLAWERASLPGIAGSGYPYSAEYVDGLAHTMWARGVDWLGFERQRRAMALTAPWAPRLPEITAPVAIVHGAEDPVIPVGAAHRLRDALPHASLRVVSDLGHQQPAELDDLFLAATTELVQACP